jgi:hypothetical protein
LACACGVLHARAPVPAAPPPDPEHEKPRDAVAGLVSRHS